MQAKKCANKANSVLGFIKRMVGPKNPQLFSKLYKSLVRPILEYCSPVWCPHLKKDLRFAQNSFQRLYLDGSLYPLLSLDATIMISKNCPIIGEHVGIIFLTQ